MIQSTLFNQVEDSKTFLCLMRDSSDLACLHFPTSMLGTATCSIATTSEGN
ncbi:hypothetical protein Fmac_016408 [Flemingia macrophylla]|uniref:Uncharacterized protein n=1 Tax=Flemingia macrophylla TaxID=520843 RepID=A0ABD1MJG9_9FABA